MGMEVNENFLYAPFQVGYNIIKDRWSVHELHNMLIQEEARLRNKGSIQLIHRSARNNQGLYKVNVSSAQIHKKEHKIYKCYFCKKLDTKKNCLKRKT
ncbi:hypothetical protein AAG906_003255 [Vitis piasezkii]